MLNKHLHKAMLLLIASMAALGAKAQNNKVGTWGIVTVTLPGDSSTRWGGYVELQTRTNKLFDQAFYYEVKGGISYDIAKNYTALIGTGRYVTYDYDNLDAPPNILETRLWEQMTVNQFLDRIKIEHRYRVEQRFFNTGYRNRFRYRLNLAIPLNHKKVEKKTAYATTFNELFVTNTEPHFERNRFYLGMGYQFTSTFAVQAGWMHQYNLSKSANGTGAKNNLAINVMYRINRKGGKPKEHIPGSLD